MKNYLKLSTLALAVTSATSVMAAEPATSITQALSDGESTINLRYRFEFVDQEAKKEAKASTLKTRLTYKSLQYKGFSTVLEFDNISDVALDNDYNDKKNGKTSYAVVADPNSTDVNQAYLDYAAPVDTTVRVGRQRILLDNQRYVGGVGWRQNEQTFDAVSLINTSFSDTKILVSHVSHVNTILNDVKASNYQLINIKNNSLSFGSITGYAYLLKDVSNTVGARFKGAADLDALNLLYTAEYAKQKDDSTTTRDANYYLAELGVKVAGIKVQASYEAQTSDSGNYSFKTPLGTNHGFNGWADKFLSTPANGLEDTFLTVSSKLAGPKIAVVYHKFDANNGGKHYGDELDLVVVKKFSKRYSVLLKYANYNADTFSVDTQKAWLQLSAKL